jgi:integrase
MPKSTRKNASPPSQIRALFLRESADAIRLRAAEVAPPRAGRGRPPEGIRLDLRKRRKNDLGIWYILGDGKPYSTGIRGDDKAGADDALALAIAAAAARASGHLAPKVVTVSEIIAAEKKVIAPKQGATLANISAIEQRSRKLDRIADFFGRDTPAQQVTPERCREYEADLCSKLSRPGTKSTTLFAPGTVRVDLAWWRKAVRRFHVERNLPCSINIYIPERPAPRSNWCDRDDIAVLVASALFGWYWDRDAERVVIRKKKDDATGEIVETWTERRRGDWTTEEVRDPQTGEFVRRRKVDPSYRSPDVRARGRALARAIFIAFFTGTRIGRLRNLTWKRDEYCGWVDIQTFLLRRSGIQSGEWSGPGRKRKKAGAAHIPPKKQAIFRRWEASDRQKGTAFIVHQPDGSAYASSQSITSRLKRVGERCGYDDLIMHEMRHSAVTVLLLNGATPLEVANYIGMSLDMVLKVYSHVAEQGTEKGAELMGAKGGRDRRSPARDRSEHKPREMMTPEEAAAAYGSKKMKAVRSLCL